MRLPYNHGCLHGTWIAADQEPEAIHEQIAWILRTSPAARRYGEVAEEWGIFDYSGFGGYRVGEYANLDTVSLVARGIAEHGPAYAEWVEYVGETADELLDDESFRDHYEGTFDSLEAYVEYILEETGFYRELERALEVVPEDLRRYIEVDVKGIAEEWGQGLHVVETEDGRVWVFDGRG
ncbi:MAG: antirestriction protein ArdA [Candidatus Dormibacteraceae bacterium]